MEENKKTSTYEADANIGNIQISDEVVAVIAGISATEVEGVYSLIGNMPTEFISKMGIKNLSKGVKIHMMDEVVCVSITIDLLYGYSIPEVCKQVQERVCNAIENMTGLDVAEVNVVVANIAVKNK